MGRRAPLLLRALVGQHGLRARWSMDASGGRRWGSTEAAPMPDRPRAPRTMVTSPDKHSPDHLGLWYTLEPDTVKRLFQAGGLPKQYMTQCQTFSETCLMVRQPALTAIDYIKRSNLEMPPNKFLFYGKDGHGKTLSLAHVTHFLAEDGWLLIHIPWAPRWRRGFKEVAPSTTRPGKYDHPLDSIVWLQHFKSQNSELLKSLQLETQEQYTWSRREVTEAGVPLVKVVEHGISRARYSSDCVMALIAELKAHATLGRCKVAVVADGINTFYCKTSRFRREDKTYVEPQHFTLFEAFMQLFSSDWKNALLVGSVDCLANDGQRRESYLPRYLLRKTGWEALDPFVPINVPEYDDREMQSVVDYYIDRNWLQNPHANSDIGRRELAALSDCNPYTLMQVCKSL